jgi:regulator of sigma E protease
MAILIFVVVLALLILFHELGHFIFAKMAKMRVDEFGIGFPPRILSKQIGETKYSLNAIPFGGFVKILGENPEEGDTDERRFSAKGKHLQILVLAGGVLFNLLLAWVLLIAGFTMGMPVSATGEYQDRATDQRMLIVSVLSNSPAQEAGLVVGDEILMLETGGQRIEGENLTPESFTNSIALGGGEDVTILFKRDGPDVNHSAVIKPTYDINPDRPIIGVTADQIGLVKLSIFEAIYKAFKMTFVVFGAVIAGLFSLIINAFSGGADLSQITGPVGIVGFIGDASALGFVYLLSFTAFISINLAVINLIPFPALDGGRILFVIIEAIKGSPISSKVANSLNVIGFLLLMLLMIVVTYNDIIKLF